MGHGDAVTVVGNRVLTGASSPQHPIAVKVDSSPPVVTWATAHATLVPSLIHGKVWCTVAAQRYAFLSRRRRFLV
jgi:hypothetical protein